MRPGAHDWSQAGRGGRFRTSRFRRRTGSNSRTGPCGTATSTDEPLPPIPSTRHSGRCPAPKRSRRWPVIRTSLARWPNSPYPCRPSNSLLPICARRRLVSSRRKPPSFSVAILLVQLVVVAARRIVRGGGHGSSFRSNTDVLPLASLGSVPIKFGVALGPKVVRIEGHSGSEIPHLEKEKEKQEGEQKRTCVAGNSI